MKKLYKSQNDFDIRPSSVKSRVIEIERKINENKHHPIKYENIKWTEELNNIGSIYANEIEYINLWKWICVWKRRRILRNC